MSPSESKTNQVEESEEENSRTPKENRDGHNNWPASGNPPEVMVVVVEGGEQ